MSSSPASANPSSLPTPQTDWALFLDFDGTLVEIAEHPDAIVVPPELPRLLRSLTDALNGAVAVVSGRSLEGLDRFLDGALPALAGVHGLERRDGQGMVYQPIDRTDDFTQARQVLTAFVDQHPGTYLEDKGNALTLHYRGAPASAAAAQALLAEQSAALGDEFFVQPGKQLFELKPTSAHKGHVVATFMQEPPFAGRTPVFLGDDVTDEDAFATVNTLGGHAIRVGARQASAATYHIDNVNEALQWLTRLATTLQPAH